MSNNTGNNYDFYQPSPQNIPADIGVNQEQKFTPPPREVNEQMDTKTAVNSQICND